jgi:hypothetical protein
VEAYKAFGDNLPVINDDPAWVLPMPARYVIGTGCVIAYSEVNPDYTRRGSSRASAGVDRMRASRRRDPRGRLRTKPVARIWPPAGSSPTAIPAHRSGR